MVASYLQQCQELIGYRFRDPNLLAEALTHSSTAPTRADSNERLEFLGDSVLGLVVCHELYAREEGLTEGQMTKIKSAVVSRQTCAEVADAIGLSELIRLGKGMPASDSGRMPVSVSAAVLESVLGAMYLDAGIDEARRFVLKHVGPHIERAFADEHLRNYKSMLQQHTQKQWGETPQYELLDEKGPDHAKCFEIAVLLRGRRYPSAWGQNKKQAEQAAALGALQELGLIEGEKEAGK